LKIGLAFNFSLALLRPKISAAFLIACFGLTGICLHSAPARAQATNYKEAKAQATKAYSGGDYASAATLFQKAFDFSPRGNLLYNIGLCHEKAGAVTEAIKFYQRFIDAVPNSNRRAAL
jgi:tetratricopeptide (TPR) repeat protein